MTVGLFGGAFDPPHNGHLALAAVAIERFALERLIVVVTGEPPHKTVETDAETRFRLAAAAFDGLEGVELSRLELERPGPSYSVDTVRWAAEKWDDVVLLVGADEFADFLSWRDVKGILARVRIGVATRPGYPSERLEPVLSTLARPESVELFAIPFVPVSSRELRARVARGERVDGFVPPAVASLIDQLGLYRRV